MSQESKVIQNRRGLLNAENKLESMPVGGLLLTMSLPMMISFFIQALYNIADSIFVARISEHALTAVSLAFPMQQLEHAISVGIGVGINAVIPRQIGSGRRQEANRTAGCGVALNLLFWLIFALLGLTSTHAIYAAQTDVREIVNLGTIYLQICWVVSFGDLFGQLFEKMLVGTGRAALAMTAQAAGAVFNIIFDPLLIFGIGPFPKMGIAGAALATVLGQVLGAAVAMILNMRKNESVRIGLKDIGLRLTSVRDILAVGTPSMITIGLGSVSTFGINQILLGYSTTAAAVYGIWMKLQNFCFMPVFGMNNGMIPILSYNHARGLNDRVKRTIRLSLTAILTYMVLLLVLLELIPGPLLMLFKASDNMLKIGLTALRFCILSLPLGGSCIILTSTMQALEHSRYTLIVNILRQFVLLTGSFAALSVLTRSLFWIWAAVPLAELVSVVISIFFERKMYRNLFSKE